MMSVDADEDTELRDLVSESLKSTGILGKLKAELRSNVYLAFEGQAELKAKSRRVNCRFDDFLSTSEGRLLTHLVREFLEFFSLDFTLSIFDPEALEGRFQSGSFKTRDKLSESLGLSEAFRSDVPLLSEILRLSKVTILRSETPSQSEDQSHKSEDETSLQSDYTREKLSMTPTQSLTPESSLTNIQNKTHNQESNNSTFIVEKDSKPEVKSSSFLSSLADLPKLGGQSSLGDLPPLNPPSRISPVKLGALKKVPSTEKQAKPDPPVPEVQAVQPALAPIPKIAPIENSGPKSNPSFEDDEEIEEDMEDFLNSSVSASDDFTKDETASEVASLKADYAEKIP